MLAMRALVSMTVLLVACAPPMASTSRPPPAAAPPRHEVVVLLAPRSGKLTAQSADLERGIRVALAEEQAAGGAAPALRVLDAAGDPDDLTAELLTIHHYDDLRAVIVLPGHPDLPDELADVPVIDPLSTERVANEYTINETDMDAGFAAANFALERSWVHAVLVIDGSGLSMSTEFAIERAFGVRAPKHPPVELVYQADPDSFAPQLAAIAQAKPDVVIVSGSLRDFELLATEARQAGIAAAFLDARTFDDVATVDETYFVDIFSADDPSVRGFVVRYTAMFGAAPATIAALGHDAGVLAAEGPESAVRATWRHRHLPVTHVPLATGPLDFLTRRAARIDGLPILHIEHGRARLIAHESTKLY